MSFNFESQVLQLKLFEDIRLRLLLSFKYALRIKFNHSRLAMGQYLKAKCIHVWACNCVKSNPPFSASVFPCFYPFFLSFFLSPRVSVCLCKASCLAMLALQSLRRLSWPTGNEGRKVAQKRAKEREKMQKCKFFLFFDGIFSVPKNWLLKGMKDQ